MVAIEQTMVVGCSLDISIQSSAIGSHLDLNLITFPHLNAFNLLFEPTFYESRSLAGSNDILLTHPVFLGTTLSVDGAIFCSSAFTVLLCILLNTFSHMKTSGTIKIKCLAALAATFLFVIFQVYLSCNFFLFAFDGIPNSSPWNANLFNNLSQKIF